MKNRRVIWKWFHLVWKDSPLVLAMIVGLSFVSAALLTTFPWLWQYLIDEVREGADPVRLNELAMWTAVVGIAHPLMYFVLQGARSVMNVVIQWRARRAVFNHLTQLDDEFYREWRAGDLVTRLYDDAGDKIAWFLCSGVFRTLEASLIVTVCIGAMLTIDPWLTLFVIFPLPILIVGQAFSQQALGRRYREVQESISAINDELTTTFSGIRIVQACGLDGAARRRFMGGAESQRKAEVRTSIVQIAVYMFYGYGWQLALVALLLAGGTAVLNETITLGQYVTFEGFVSLLVFPMFDVGMFVSKYQQTGVALTRLETLMEVSHVAEGSTALPHAPDLHLEGVAVTAEDGSSLLQEVDLQVGAGRMLAIVGEVGSGKTVLMDLLAGSRRSSGGRVRIGGVDADAVSGRARGAIGYVPQDAVLLSATLRENILLGREVAAENLEAALEVSRLSQDLSAFPDGLETAVGERGVTLSGGQQQRVALARALVGSPDILLLDDATAALDADTETAFWGQLNRVLPYVTAVVVTHRIATIQRADEIMVMEGGRAVQRGLHADLIDNDGPYRRIYGRIEMHARATGA